MGVNMGVNKRASFLRLKEAVPDPGPDQDTCCRTLRRRLLPDPIGYGVTSIFLLACLACLAPMMMAEPLSRDMYGINCWN